MSIKNEHQRKATERALQHLIKAQRRCQDPEELFLLQEAIDQLNQELLDYALQLN